MNKSILLKENLLNLLGLVFMTTSLITIVGFYDEGHHKIYGSFSNYLFSGGYPPATDYMIWIVLGSLPGVLSFNLISIGMKKALFRYRFLLAFVCTPLFFFSLLFGFGLLLS